MLEQQMLLRKRLNMLYKGITDLDRSTKRLEKATWILLIVAIISVFIAIFQATIAH